MSSYIFGKIDMSGYNIEEDVKYLNTIHKQPEEYDEFGQGYWKIFPCTMLQAVRRTVSSETL